MSSAEKLRQPDLKEAERFLTLLDEEADGFCFRVFDDLEGRKDPKRARKLNGELSALGSILARSNTDDCGVFVAINHGGQDAAHIKRVRAIWADTDGAPLAPLLNCGLEPHLVVQTSPNKYHVYWLVDGLPLDQFADIQRAIAARFGTDPSVNDLPRVMRLPGFWHCKGEPFQVCIVQASEAQPYSAAQALEHFPPAATPEPAPSSPTLGNVVEINRHASILKETRFLAQDVAQGHLTYDEALRTMRDRVAQGRYSRVIPDDEIVRALDGAIRKADRPATPTKPQDPYWGFRFANDMVANLGPTRWLVQKLIPEDCTGVLYGPSGSLKSFVFIDVALSIATGRDWQGKPTKARTVFYLAGEGEQGFAKRVAAWCAHNATPAPSTFAFRQIPRLQDADDLERLVDTIRAIEAERGQAGLIVIDTLFTALDGGDENSGKDMGQMIAAMKRLRLEFGAACFAVHHTGKVGETARGHSSLPSGMDVMIYAKPGPTPLTVEITNPKQKDGAEHPSMLLQALTHELPIIGEDGQRETSLVLSNPAAAVLDAYKVKTKLTEEAVVKASASADARDQAEDRIKKHALDRMGEGVDLRTLEREVELLAQSLGFPNLARGRSTLSTWKREAGL
ncbi:AAA family ATPase [Lysobacter enzymogenes]|uniref:AAA family ATPase n=1 Tax=Lysobacter enzymogenes TaxID=69 RepID=UPI001A95E322|nr:AAA family ATPase [Lysobacter enzymogenes]QQP96523.1 AAA family ATPase [Lysobacter enzymogenes]